MDFFEKQDRARRRTTLLVVYFAVAVAGIVAALNAVVAFGLARTGEPRTRRHGHEAVEAVSGHGLFRWRPDAMLWTTGLTLAVIAGGTFHRWMTLRGGGRAVAEMVGGQPVPPNATDPALRRLLNIIEEMSIASGVPMPAVFVLEGEPGINAFAAGYTPSDAAIAVTRGCLEKLSRDELQGVVAHEFSHLLNGDMRLNIRLLGVLYGIFMLAVIGRGLLRSLHFAGGGSRRSKGGGGGVALVVGLGLALLVVGYIGYFFGRLIQAAVSRQREFLADAAAVQFTRNPAGIGGALRKIGGYAIGSGIVTEQATQLRHFFFAQSFVGGLDWFATHPPLDQRIRTIDPQWDGRFPDITAATIAGWEPGGVVPQRPFVPPDAPPPPLPTAVLLASVGTPTAGHLAHARRLLAALPPSLASAAREPAESLFVVFFLLLAGAEPVRTRQLDLIRVRHGVPFSEAFAAFLPRTAGLANSSRLPLLNLALPALRALAPAEVTGAVDTAKALIAADEEVTLFEFMVEQALERHVAAPARGGRPGATRFYSFGALREFIELLLSALSRVGAGSADGAAGAFAAASARIPPLQGQMRLLPVEACTLEGVSRALDQLTQASPAIRKVVLAAGTDAVASDGVLESDEAELLRAVADALDCPVPPLISGGET